MEINPCNVLTVAGSTSALNGHRRGKQNHICVACSRQFIEPAQPRGYSDDVKRLCLRMYVNGMGIRGIARVTGITHPTIINWIKHTGERLPDAYDPDQLPQVGELDELETFVGSCEKQSVAVDCGRPFPSGLPGLGSRKPQN